MTEPLPRLRAVTTRLDELPDLVALADPHDPLVWVRGDRGCVGLGELIRWEFTGPNRFRDAADAWRKVSKLAKVDDAVNLPGTGLIALGTFSFADTIPERSDEHSAAVSVLVVPKQIIARHGSVAWVTDISIEASDESFEETHEHGPPTHPRPAPAGQIRFAELLPSVTERSELGPWVGADLFASDAGATGESPEVVAYLEGVREANRRIARGEVEKVVLSRQLTTHISADADLRVPLQRLSEHYLDCWTFAIDGLFGASPETLIRSTGGAVSARVLAGTRPRHPDDPATDSRTRNELLTSDKDQHEHAFAVQSVVTALAPFLPDLRTSEEPFALELPNVWHLATDLGATLATSTGTNAVELVGALHPTAAVAGTPTQQAVDMIAELEPFDRGRYAGAVGWIDQAGGGEWVIALRCAQLGQSEAGSRTLTAFAGGGIVLGSDPEHELAETVSKFAPIAGAIASTLATPGLE